MYMSLSLWLCLSLSLSLSIFLVRLSLFITLIKCLKGHKSLGSLCSVVKTLIVSGNRPSKQPTKGQGHLLSCSGQLKRDGAAEGTGSCCQVIGFGSNFAANHAQSMSY